MGKLVINKFDIRQSTYRNAVSYKFDNRRITIYKDDGGFGFEFRTIDKNYTPHAICECIKGKVAVTTLRLSREASELLMLSLAEQMGFDVIDKQRCD